MLFSKRLLLRALELEDINTTYLGWLKDPDVNRFIETRFQPQSLETLRTYWQKHCNDSTCPWFAICLVEDSRHIGNIKLGPIHSFHRRADMSLFIGDRNCWGKGLATEAISLVRDWAFKELDIQKINAGIYSLNMPSIRAFEKCGFELEGTLRDESFNGGQRMDILRYGLPRSMWKPQV